MSIKKEKNAAQDNNCSFDNPKSVFLRGKIKDHGIDQIDDKTQYNK